MLTLNKFVDQTGNHVLNVFFTRAMQRCGLAVLADFSTDSDTLEWALPELHSAQQEGSVRAGSSNPATKSAAAGTKPYLNCIGSFIITNKTFISCISLIYFPWFKALVCVRALEGSIAVHLKKAFALAIPRQSSNTQDSIRKTQHKHVFESLF